MLSLLDLFCDIDDFCQEFLPQLRRYQVTTSQSRQRKRSLCQSEIITILIAFQLSHYREFKNFYLSLSKRDFPGLVSYNRFIEYIPSVLIIMVSYRNGKCTGISFVDSTKLVVCHNKRIHNHKVFKDQAKRGKTSTGWFFGFKLHLVFSDEGQILSLAITAGNVDDRVPVATLFQRIFGKVYGDKGYISQELFTLLFADGIELITKSKKGMKPRLMRYVDRILLRKRAIAETIIDQLKNICQVEHTRHRAASGFLWNLLSALIAYSFLPKKPSLHLRDTRDLATA
jgi:Transposase DDE domain